MTATSFGRSDSRKNTSKIGGDSPMKGSKMEMSNFGSSRSINTNPVSVAKSFSP